MHCLFQSLKTVTAQLQQPLIPQNVQVTLEFQTLLANIKRTSCSFQAQEVKKKSWCSPSNSGSSRILTWSYHLSRFRIDPCFSNLVVKQICLFSCSMDHTYNSCQKETQRLQTRTIFFLPHLLYVLCTFCTSCMYLLKSKLVCILPSGWRAAEARRLSTEGGAWWCDHQRAAGDCGGGAAVVGHSLDGPQMVGPQACHVQRGGPGGDLCHEHVAQVPRLQSGRLWQPSSVDAG